TRQACANHRMVAIRGPWIESIGETHEGQGNRHEEGAPPSPHRRDGPCCGDFWIFGEHLGSNAPQWPRTAPWLEVWLKVRRSGRGCVPRLRPAAGGVEPPVDARRPLPGRHEVAARRYLKAADGLAPVPKQRTGPRLREARSGFGCLGLVAVSAATGVSGVAGLLNN